jgi:hypothetical protein
VVLHWEVQKAEKVELMATDFTGKSELLTVPAGGAQVQTFKTKVEKDVSFTFRAINDFGTREFEIPIYAYAGRPGSALEVGDDFMFIKPSPGAAS